MHISKDSTIDIDKVQDSLNLINTTSPSYPILANIEGTIDFLNSKKGKNAISKLLLNIYNFKKSLSRYENIHIFSENNDVTKILIKIDGIDGFTLSELLFDKFKIEDELANEKSVLFLTGIGTTKSKLNKLKKALIKISKQVSSETGSEFEEQKCTEICEPKVVFSPQKVYNMDYKSVKVEACIGQISKELIINYPPGMPIIIPGELIQESHLPLLKDYTTIKVLNN